MKKIRNDILMENLIKSKTEERLSKKFKKLT